MNVNETERVFRADMLFVCVSSPVLVSEIVFRGDLLLVCVSLAVLVLVIVNESVNERVFL